MAKKTTELKATKPENASHEAPSGRYWREHLGVDEDPIATLKIVEIAGLLWVPEDAPQKDVHTRLIRALEQFESLAPADGAEGMLALQMVATHDAALECLRRAAIANQTFEGRDMALKHAQKLMTLYTKQLETLNKHRGKGQQKVTVEHVNVQAGGQAIVGTVEAGKPGRQRGDAEPALEHQREVPVAEEAPKRKAPRKNRSG